MDRSRSQPSTRVARVVTAAVVIACTMLCLPAAASADHSESTIFDPGNLLYPGYSAAYRARTMDRIAALGADTVRVLVPWRSFAPQPDSSQAPVGFDAGDPRQYRQQSFDILDQMVGDAEQAGLRVLLTPTGPAPNWASASPVNDHVYPNPALFGKFVSTLGIRYSGHCPSEVCGSGPPPQRVSFWSVWNEPNLALFLRPQIVHGRSVSGRFYRRLFLAAQRGLKATGHGSDPVLIGETAPSRGAVSTQPLDFLRDVLCLSPRYSRRGDCSPIHAVGWAQHPYTPGVAPWQRPAGRGVISIGSLDLLTRALSRAAVAGATVHRLPVYVTEFGIESHPKPSEQFGLNQVSQAEYLGIAEYLLYRNPWVRSYAQYLMDDDAGNPVDHLTFDTGLRFSDDKPKLAYSAFPITLVARQEGQGNVELWGHVRPAGGCDVQLNYLDADGTGGSLGPIATNSNGYFDLGTGSRPDRRWQASCTMADGRQLQGPQIRAYQFPGR